uniref:Interleukin 26 n=1 Tax=Sinocyclocheilus grahami TaxID=75366 RepID=A0A672JYS9_SINGR
MRIVALLALCTVLCSSQGHKQEECLNQHITPPMIKDMMETSELIQKSLPRDNAPFHRILGKLKKCSKKLNVADFKRILEIYDEHVFQKLWKNNSHQLPKMFTDSFVRLKDMMEICNILVKLLKLQLQPKGLLKAQSEFRHVLVWISIAMDKSRTHEIH